MSSPVKEEECLVPGAQAKLQRLFETLSEAREVAICAKGHVYGHLPQEERTSEAGACVFDQLTSVQNTADEILALVRDTRDGLSAQG
jgi:hypothetical protein